MYFMLFTRESDGHWHPQFGDKVRSVVVEEAKDSYSDYRAKDRKIVKFDRAPRQALVDQHAATMFQGI